MLNQIKIFKIYGENATVYIKSTSNINRNILNCLYCIYVGYKNRILNFLLQVFYYVMVVFKFSLCAIKIFTDIISVLNAIVF